MPLLLTLILFILILLIGAGYYFYRIAFFPRVYTAAETLRMEVDNNRLLDYPALEAWVSEGFTITSPHGYELSGQFYPGPDARKFIILSHGITLNRYGSLKYMPIFRKHGFNIVVYDNRCHGRSGGKACSFGFFEKYDLKAVVDWIINRFGTDLVIGTHGESLGAAITLQHAALDPRIAFAISDCAFSDLHRLFKIRLRADYHLPSFPLLNLSGWFAGRLLGFNYRESSPIKNIHAIQTPILFIHGDQDGYIPQSMSVEMHQRKTSGLRALYLAKGAKHAEALVIDRAEYQAQVDSFLSTIGVIASIAEPGIPV